MTEIKITAGTLCDGTSVSRDLKRLPHLLIAGGGKNEARTYLASLLAEAVRDISPDDIRVLALHCDATVNSLPHLLCPAITDTGDAEAALEWLRNEVDRRFALLAGSGTRSIDAYNEKADEKLFYIIAACGLEELTSKSREKIAMLAAKARAAGVHLAVCSEKADTKTISGIVKANIPSRIALKAQAKAESRTILDCTGAEKLEANELLFLPIGQNTPERLTYSLPKAKELEDAFSAIASAYPRAEYIPLASSAQKKPPVMVRALETALRFGSVSTALLQRALHIGYARAANIIDEMENAGYISKYEHSKPRKVLLTESELERLIKELTDKEI